MIPTLSVDDRHATLFLDQVGPKAIELIRQALSPIAVSMEAKARALAEAHIHLVGETSAHHVAKPGQYLASIHGGVSVKGTRIIGYVRSGDPLAHLLEFGAHPGAHEILPSAADVLAFDMPGVGEVFARSVNFPGADIPAYPALYPAFDAERGDIETALEKVKAELS